MAIPISPHAFLECPPVSGRAGCPGKTFPGKISKWQLLLLLSLSSMSARRRADIRKAFLEKSKTRPFLLMLRLLPAPAHRRANLRIDFPAKVQNSIKMTITISPNPFSNAHPPAGGSLIEFSKKTKNQNNNNNKIKMDIAIFFLIHSQMPDLLRVDLRGGFFENPPKKGGSRCSFAGCIFRCGAFFAEQGRILRPFRRVIFPWFRPGPLSQSVILSGWPCMFFFWRVRCWAVAFVGVSSLGVSHVIVGYWCRSVLVALGIGWFGCTVLLYVSPTRPPLCQRYRKILNKIGNRHCGISGQRPPPFGCLDN